MSARLKQIEVNYERASIQASLAGWLFARAASAIEAARWSEAETAGKAALVALEESCGAASCEWTAEEILAREG